MTPTVYLLDTSILVLLIRGSVAGRGVAANFGLTAGLNRAMISVVTVGEIYAFARKLNWGDAKIEALEELLDQVVWVDINHPDILSAYGELDHFANSQGRTMGKNDLWIAATVKVGGLTLLTTDTDFDFLYPDQITRIRIDDKTGTALP